MEARHPQLRANSPSQRIIHSLYLPDAPAKGGLRGGAPVDSPPMTDLDEQGRPEPPVAGDETATLLGSLERQRATLAWKCGDWTRPA